jgi:hypothetical protein
MTKKILAIDVGIKNFSYCYLSYDPKGPSSDAKILEWDVIPVIDPKSKCRDYSFERLSEAMLSMLNDRFVDNYDADLVLIENQPATKNRTMKSISVVIYSYFIMLKQQFGTLKRVSFVSATNKLKCTKRSRDPSCAAMQQKTYAQRKKLAIAMTAKYLKDIDPARSEWFAAQGKRDDLSDAFLMGMHHIEQNLFFKP